MMLVEAFQRRHSQAQAVYDQAEAWSNRKLEYLWANPCLIKLVLLYRTVYFDSELGVILALDHRGAATGRYLEPCPVTPPARKITKQSTSNIRSLRSESNIIIRKPFGTSRRQTSVNPSTPAPSLEARSSHLEPSTVTVLLLTNRYKSE